METLIVSINGAVATIRFNRPERLNAVNEVLYGEFQKVLEELDASDARVVVLGGEGRAFCVGADLKEHGAGTRTSEQKKAYSAMEQSICLQILQHRLPFIAAVHGYALGAGAEIALSCDFVLMEESAKIGFPEISIGTYIGGGLTAILPMLVGLTKAKEMILLGQRYSGSEAEQMGLIHKSVKDGTLLSETDILALELASKAPIPMAFAKRQLRDHAVLSPESVSRIESDTLFACMQTKDWEEGVAAFREKRSPKFTGK